MFIEFFYFKIKICFEHFAFPVEICKQVVCFLYPIIIHILNCATGLNFPVTQNTYGGIGLSCLPTLVVARL